ncbi:MAG: phosphoenolpyruvate--protein phosphotransferase [Azospirillum sp.]|nr:phosphoenolpyruvate--protein phosphotransferase [Azospirillum sp.]
MAGSGTGEQRLGRIVRLIATEMGADVCSCYVLRAGEVLELFATVGLNPMAVHKTRLRVGEGIIGDIAAHAKAIALADAPSHPRFAYRPETGEEPFHSMLGVPILRGGRVRGVLAIQHREERQYGDDEGEILETVAMVIADLIAAGDLLGAQEKPSLSAEALLPSRLSGVGLHRGMAMGLAVMHRHQLTITQVVADDPEREMERLHEALTRMHRSIDALVARSMAAHSDEPRDILETYRMIAEDRGWLGRIGEAIHSGLTADAAVSRVQNDTRARMNQISDPYLRERLLDFDDLAYRLLQHLAGKTSASDGVPLPDDCILVARSLGPAELLDYDRTRLRGVVLEEGTTTSHVAIVARALNIPVVGQCTGALSRIEHLDPLVIDGNHGQVFVRPGEDIQSDFADSLRRAENWERLYAEGRDLPSISRDGVAVSIQINCGLLLDLAHLADSGADGIGLYRTEIPFMVQSTYPDVPTQTALYAKVIEQAAGRRVVFRTLDVGGDKRLPYFFTEPEENPAMGWRAIRIGLDRPAMLRQQLRALLRAAAGRPLHLMFPMVAEVAEYDDARRILDMELARLARDGHPAPAALQVGVMLEVPALLWQLPALLPRVDFLSIGSNDLSQFLFAYDRGNPRLGNRYDSLSPALLSALRQLVDQCRAAEVPLSLCGEIAGRPLDAMALIGIGLRALSMSAPSVGPVKTMLRSLDVGAVSHYLDSLYRRGDRSLRNRLRAFARDHGVVI